MVSLTAEDNLIVQIAKATCFMYRVDAQQVPPEDLDRYVEELRRLYVAQGSAPAPHEAAVSVDLEETIAFCVAQLAESAPVHADRLRSLLPA